MLFNYNTNNIDIRKYIMYCEFASVVSINNHLAINFQQVEPFHQVWMLACLDKDN